MTRSPKPAGLVVRQALTRAGRAANPALLSTQAVGDVETRHSPLLATGPGTLPAAVVRFEGACEVIGGLLFVLLAVAVFLLLWVYTADPACWSAE